RQAQAQVVPPRARRGSRRDDGDSDAEARAPAGARRKPVVRHRRDPPGVRRGEHVGMKLSQAPIRFWRSREQPPAPGPGPVPPPAREPRPPAPDPQPPMPEPTPPAPELRAVSAPEPAADPGRAAVAPIPLNGAPREWNVWDLERLARDGEAREGELAFL